MNKSILYILLLLNFSLYSQQTGLKLAADAWPPFTNVEGEKSILTDLVGEALTRMNTESTVTIIKFNDVLSEIESRKYDGSPALWISDERKEKYIEAHIDLASDLLKVAEDLKALGYI